MIVLRVLSLRRGGLLGRFLDRNAILTDQKLFGVSYSEDRDELNILLELLEYESLIAWQAEGYALKLTIKGIVTVEKMGAGGRRIYAGLCGHVVQP